MENKDVAEKNMTEKKESICDRRVMELKEAEKTIANKDVIIRMLQDQVKKLEGSYKENLKETESFRYKYYLASEQIKRLRCCPPHAAKSEEENRVKELRCDLAKWKHKCDQLMTCKESPIISEKCRYAQQIQDIEKIMNSHYDLLQNLVGKILEKNSKNELEPAKTEADNNQNDDQIAKLEQEIARLKEENSKLQKNKLSAGTDDIEPIIKVKDSLIDAYKRSQANLQKKVSSLMANGSIGDNVIDQEGHDMENRKVSFSKEASNIEIELDTKQSLNYDAMSAETESIEMEKESKQTRQHLFNLEQLVLGEEESCKEKNCKIPRADTASYNTIETEKEDDNFATLTSSHKVSKVQIIEVDVLVHEYRKLEQDEVISDTESFASSQMTLETANNTSPTDDTPGQENLAQKDEKRCYCITTQTPECPCASILHEKTQITDKNKETETGDDASMVKRSETVGKSCKCITTQTPTCPCASKETSTLDDKTCATMDNKLETVDKSCECITTQTHICYNASKQTSMVHDVAEAPHEKDEIENLQTTNLQETQFISDYKETPTVAVEDNSNMVKNSQTNKVQEIQCGCDFKDYPTVAIEGDSKMVKNSETKNNVEELRSSCDSKETRTTIECGPNLVRNSQTNNSEGIQCGCDSKDYPTVAIEGDSKMIKNSETTNNVEELRCSCDSKETRTTIECGRNLVRNSQTNNSEGVQCGCDSKGTLIIEIECDPKIINNSQTNNLHEMVQKLNEIGSRVSEVLDKQVHTCKELELLKAELAGSRDTTEVCSENISKLSARINEQKVTFIEKFQEHQQVTDNLISVNGEITKELSELKDKIELLFKNIEELNQLRKLTDSSDDISVEECQYQTCKPREDKISKKPVDEPPQMVEPLRKEEQEDCICIEEKEKPDSHPSNDLDVLEAKFMTLEEANKQKDQQIKCIDALIAYYKKAHENVVAINAQTAEKIQNQMDDQCPCEEDELDKYIENAKSENLKLKTAISSVINCLTIKVSELKGGSMPLTSSTYLCVGNENDIEPFECKLCLESESSDGNTVRIKTAVTTPQLELEDIYQAVKRTITHNCRGSSYTPNHTVSDTCTCYSSNSNPSDEDNYSCVFCACVSESKIVAKKDSSKSHPNKPLSCESCGAHESNSRNDTMITNLETYIQYLHEQLHIISSIESRIEELRFHVKESQ